MAYQDPSTGEWYTDEGIPFSQAGEGQPGSYLPGYMPPKSYEGGNNADGGYVSPVTNEPAYSSWPDYQAGYVPPSSGVAAPPDIGTALYRERAADTAPDGGTTGADSTLGPWTERFQAPTTLRGLPPLPGVTPAPRFNFKAPSVEDALKDPGYEFRRTQGEGSLQRAAAARGTLNDSGTLKALIDYGQNAASQEYANVWNRDYNVAREAYAPEFATWQAGNGRQDLGYSTTAQYNQRADENDYLNAWNQYLDRENLWKFNVGGAVNLAGM